MTEMSKQAPPRLHDRIREVGSNRFVKPARLSGSREFSIAVRSLIDAAGKAGISTNGRIPAFCSAIQTAEFLEDNRVDVVRVDGPPSKRSTTVVVHYRFRDSHLPMEEPTRVPAGDRFEDFYGRFPNAFKEGALAFVREMRKDKGVAEGEEYR